MGNTIKRTVDYLRDPCLVRRVQETFGVQQIVIQPGEESNIEFSGHRTADRTCNGIVKTNGGMVNGGLEWLTTVKRARRKVKCSPTNSPQITPPLSPSMSDGESKPNTTIIIESIPLLDLYFRLATEFGYEAFYISFFSFTSWNIDSLVSRRAAILWCISMYVGQACKAIVKWKRPPSPPVFRLEDNPKLEEEFGFPSTHAIVAVTIPFYYLYSCFGRYEFPLWIALPIALTWCTSVCLSRIYLGVHTIMDIVGGALMSLLLLAVTIPGIALIDHYVLYSSYAPFVALACTIFLLYIYPIEPDRWTMDRGDTAAILGAGLGFSTGFWFHGPYPDDLDPGPFLMMLPSLQVIGMCVIRFVIGILLIIPVRFVMKLLCFKLLPAIMPTNGVKEVVKRPLVELSYKIITYSTIGFTASYVAPVMFDICNIGVQEDDIVLTSSQCSDCPFLLRESVVTEKLDGGNCSIFQGKVYARTVSSEATHASFGPIKQLASQISYLLPANIQLFGENMFGIHSIEYDRLESFFYIFAGLRDGSEWLSWDHVTELANEIGVPSVPVVVQTQFSSLKEVADLMTQSMEKPSQCGSCHPEGFVIRTVEQFPYDYLDKHVAKFVRAGHVQTEESWKRTWRQAKLNKLH